MEAESGRTFVLTCALGKAGFGWLLWGWEGSQDPSALAVTSGKACRVTPDLEVVSWGDAGVFLSK